MKDPKVEAVRIVRQAQMKQMEEGIFCNKHHMKLQEILHIEMEKQLGKIAMQLEDILGTGYVSAQ